ncbi:hypothetical protein MMC10_001764 [Thelotrema lepadinum]|nr:hypothetical protein [Thelotrema lepadinum]
MASVFTYDPDPPRISSPWSGTPSSTPRLQAVGESNHEQLLGGLAAPAPSLLLDTSIVKLEAEPQEGPTEYKLHLLLRPRRSFSSISTGPYVSGSHQSKNRASPSSKNLSAPKLAHRGSSSTPPFQARQKRLEHLTTQLLWRLQQSSPYHSSSTVKLVPPALPETGPVLGPPANTGKLLPGLEESRGALYEIGLTDDGAFVGLTKEEMDESLINLRAMSASLGCKVEILRTVIVGECQWTESSQDKEGVSVESVRNEKLWVVEALVLPDTNSHSSQGAPVSPLDAQEHSASSIIKSGDSVLQTEDSRTEQLRVSLTGSTTSGKSSLVGTLSTSALDSGRGKTRLHLLKHRHEIESGVTSSVAPELIGYQSNKARNENGHPTTVVNYGLGNVSSWNDVHNAAEGDRLVFLVDSAGHPRYRRTTVRGLVSWAPHWIFCCIAADEEQEASAVFGAAPAREDVAGSGATDVDHSKAHLELCLKLGLPLVIVITKLDAATNQGLRSVLSRALSILKAHDRNPVILKPDSIPRLSEELQHIPSKDEDEVRSMFVNSDISTLVPIIFTSAVKGSGITKLHALLRHLPLPQHVGETHGTAMSRSPSSVFHVDEIFSRAETAETTESTSGHEKAASTVFILSGHLEHYEISLGDNCLLGPFSIDTEIDVGLVEMSRTRSFPSRLSSSPVSQLSHSEPRPQSHLDVVAPRRTNRPSLEASVEKPLLPDLAKEWLPIRVVSIRNLRLPLRKLLAGQVGTVGIEFTDHKDYASAASKLRKGMVLVRPMASHTEADFPRARSGFKAIFPAKDYPIMEPGAAFNVYIVSIRASAKIVSVEALASTSSDLTDAPEPSDSPVPSSNDSLEDEESLFMFDAEAQQFPLLSRDAKKEVRSQPLPPKNIEVVFHFIGSREWIEMESQVLVMPKMVDQGVSGLDGCVGKVRGLI